MTLVYFLLQVTTAAASGGPQLTHLTKERAQVPKRRPPRKFKPMDEDDVCIVFTIVIVCCVISICVFMFMCVLLYVVCVGIHNILLKAFLPVCMKCIAQEYNGKCSRRGKYQVCRECYKFHTNKTLKCCIEFYTYQQLVTK